MFERRRASFFFVFADDPLFRPAPSYWGAHGKIDERYRFD